MSKRVIAFHIGLPKTATSTLQLFFYQNIEILNRYNVDYPNFQNDIKHSILVKSFNDENFKKVKAGLKRSFDKGHERIVLSNESIVNSFYKLSPISITKFNNMVNELDAELEIYLVDRDISSWTLSYYKQSIVNQSSERMGFYSTHLKYDEFCEIDYIKKLIDRDSLIEDLSRQFQCIVKVINYKEDGLSKIVDNILGFNFHAPSFRKEHISLPNHIVELLRQLNGRIEKKKQKYAWCKLIETVCTFDISHNTFKALSERADEEYLKLVDIKVLNEVSYQDNPPMIVGKNEFNELKSALLMFLSACDQ